MTDQSPEPCPCGCAVSSWPISPKPPALDDLQEQIAEAIIAVRDARPRLPHDADSWDIATAVMDVLRREGMVP